MFMPLMSSSSLIPKILGRPNAIKKYSKRKFPHSTFKAQICAPGQAAIATELVRSYLQWHSADLLDWHILTGNEQLLPGSCAKLARKEVGTKGKDGGKGGGGGGMKRRLMKEGKLEGNGGEGHMAAMATEDEEDDDPVLKAMEVAKV
jgi:hypothetical protein